MTLPVRPVRACLFLGSALLSAAFARGEAPPKSWVDPDTGHQVIRLTDEPGSDSFYFNFNAYTPDGHEMVYTTPEGISVLDLRTRRTRRLVAGIKRAIMVGRRTPTIYYSKPTPDPYVSTLWSTNLDTGATREIATLPRRATVYTINADETLGAGDFIEGDANAGGAYDGTPRTVASRMSRVNLGEPANKGALMVRRFNARLPMTVFTIDLRSGQVEPLLEHNPNWIDHEQFSPTDPTLLLYAHEGPWQWVDRIWTVRTDGTQNRLMVHRFMQMEIAGHEWWDPDGRTIWYQHHLPRYAPGASYLSSVNIVTGQAVWYHYGEDSSSIHHNTSPDGKLFCGDGNAANPWIVLCRPVRIPDHHTLGSDLVGSGYLKAERLVNLARHNYRLEPNPSFTPDMKWIVFRSNMFGPDYVFAVSVAKGG